MHRWKFGQPTVPDDVIGAQILGDDIGVVTRAVHQIDVIRCGVDFLLRRDGVVLDSRQRFRRSVECANTLAL